MGIIQKQTLKGTIYAYMGVFLGFINTGLLLPNIITATQNGLIGLLNSYSGIFALVATLGFNSTIVRMFTYFRNDENQHNGFFSILILVAIIGSVLSFCLYFFLKPIIVEANIDKSALFLQYYNYVYPFIFFSLLFYFLDNYFTVLYNATLGMFLNEFLKRVFFSIAIVLFYFHCIDFRFFVILYIGAFAVPPTVMIVKLIIEKQFYWHPQFHFLDKKLIKSLLNVSLFSFISSFAGVVVMRTDIIMLSAMLSLSATGIYSITYFFGTLIRIPSRPLSKIAAALYADAWKNNDLAFIRDIYKKSVINQAIFGVLLFIGVWANIENIFHILPPEYAAGRYVIFFIALSALVEMLSGSNNVIISTSSNYRLITYFTIILVFLTIATNYIFIPIYGVTGAALASFISILTYNLLRYFFLLIRYKLQVFDYKLVIVLVIGVFTYYLQTLIPEMNNFVLDIILRSTFISCVFGILIYATKVSPLINKQLQKYWNLLFNLIKY